MGLEIINTIKKRMNLTTEELSKLSGVPIGTLNKILNGTTKDPKLETLKALARVLNCTLDDFDDVKQEKETLFTRLPDFVTTLEEAKAVNKLLPGFGSEGKEPSDDELIDYINDILDYIRFKNLKLK